MRSVHAALLLALLPLAGCFGNDGRDGGTPTPTTDAKLHAPWWEIGEGWIIEFEQAGSPSRTTTLVNFANNTFGDPPHFWLGTRDRQEALDHVFFDNNPFLGRIHWEILAPHEKGMHSAMYSWPLEDGSTWTSPILFGKEDVVADATKRDDGTIEVRAVAQKDGAKLVYDYDPTTKWFREMEILEDDGALDLRASVTKHTTGERGTFYFLRGRDYLDADGGNTGEEETFEVKEEGATSIAFLLDVRTTTPAAALEFLDPTGTVWHRETLQLGGTADKVVEVSKHPPAGTWKLRYVGSVTGEIKVRGIIEYKATL